MNNHLITFKIEHAIFILSGITTNMPCRSTLSTYDFHNLRFEATRDIVFIDGTLIIAYSIPTYVNLGRFADRLPFI